MRLARRLFTGGGGGMRLVGSLLLLFFALSCVDATSGADKSAKPGRASAAPARNRTNEYFKTMGKYCNASSPEAVVSTYEFWVADEANLPDYELIEIGLEKVAKFVETIMNGEVATPSDGKKRSVFTSNKPSVKPFFEAFTGNVKPFYFVIWASAGTLSFLVFSISCGMMCAQCRRRKQPATPAASATSKSKVETKSKKTERSSAGADEYENLGTLQNGAAPPAAPPPPPPPDPSSPAPPVETKGKTRAKTTPAGSRPVSAPSVQYKGPDRPAPGVPPVAPSTLPSDFALVPGSTTRTKNGGSKDNKTRQSVESGGDGMAGIGKQTAGDATNYINDQLHKEKKSSKEVKKSSKEVKKSFAEAKRSSGEGRTDRRRSTPSSSAAAAPLGPPPEKKGLVYPCTAFFIKIVFYITFISTLIVMIVASGLFALSTKSHLEFAANRQALVTDQIEVLRSEMMKIGCQSENSVRNRWTNMVEVVKDDKPKVPDYIELRKNEILAEYAKYKKMKAVAGAVIKNSNNNDVNRFTFLMTVITNAQSKIASGQELKEKFDVIKNCLSDTEKIVTDERFFGAANEDLATFIEPVLQSEFSSIQGLVKVGDDSSSIVDKEFFKKLIVSKTVYLEDSTKFYHKLLSGAGLSVNPLMSYASMGAATIIFILMFLFICCRLPLLLYLLAIISSALIVLPALTLGLNPSAPLQNGCYYLAKNGHSVAKAALDWGKIKSIEAKNATAACQGKSSYGKVLGPVIDRVIDNDVEIVKKNLDRAIIKNVLISDSAYSAFDTVLSKLESYQKEVEQQVQCMSRINIKDCNQPIGPTAPRPSILCDENTGSVTWASGGTEQHFWDLIRTVQNELSTMTANDVTVKDEFNYNPLTKTVQRLKELNDREAFASYVRATLHRGIDEAARDVKKDLYTAIKSSCHLTTIYENTVRRACDPIAQPSNAIVHVNFVIAFIFPLCGATMILFGFLTAHYNREKEKEQEEKREQEKSDIPEASQPDADPATDKTK